MNLNELKIFDKYEDAIRKRILSALQESINDENFVNMRLFGEELECRAFGPTDIFKIVSELVKYLNELSPYIITKDILAEQFPDITFLVNDKDVKDFHTPRVTNIYWGID